MLKFYLYIFIHFLKQFSHFHFLLHLFFVDVSKILLFDLFDDFEMSIEIKTHFCKNQSTVQGHFMIYIQKSQNEDLMIFNLNHIHCK